MSEAVPTPAWFRQAIAQGLVRLVALSLPGTPPAETIELTREAWIEALWPTRAWDERLDAQRIAEAFRSLMLSSERWPAPVHLLRTLPPRPEPLKLPEPPPDEESRRRILDALRQARGILSR
ncbi:MAG TPA: hypothetical protein VNK67_05935 [Burkholderiales bacterium]|nr:hypothetical protein [Burkholderiales bacterium]